jgi:2-polyprenyl-3-methyl-5-hydroxy-6-metoxy-1,4-benzoquinol methylase
MNPCPLCLGKNLCVIEKIQTKELYSIYQKNFKINPDQLLKFDILNFCQCNQCGLKFFSPMITGDHAFYKSLQGCPWYYQESKSEFEFAKQFISPGDQILEIGCGSGQFLKCLSINSHYKGLDVNLPDELKGNPFFSDETLEDHVLNINNYYDVVCSFQVMEHLNNPREFIKQCLSALKEKGTLIISVPAEDSYLKEVYNGVLNMPPHHATRWSDRSLTAIASIYNLQLLKIHHEKIQDEHKHTLSKTIIFNKITKTLKITPRLLYNRSFGIKLLSLLSGLVSKFNFKEIQDFRGNTVTCIFKK